MKNFILIISILYFQNIFAQTTDGQVESYIKFKESSDRIKNELLKNSSMHVQYISLMSKDPVDCNSNANERFLHNCNELKRLAGLYQEQINNQKKFYASLGSLVSNSSIPPLDVSQKVKTIIDLKVLPPASSFRNCSIRPDPGFKCIATDVKNSRGESYKVNISYNRVDLESRGSVMFTVGGSGIGGGIVSHDPPFAAVTETLDKEDKIRLIIIDMADPAPKEKAEGGYWLHGGGYHEQGYIFNEILKFIFDQRLIVGNFLNYLGGSNGSMFIASAMARHNVDLFFDRVVLQMGPFLPSLAEACNPKSYYSFTIAPPGQTDYIKYLFGLWSAKDQTLDICTKLPADNMSLLAGNAHKNYPRTHVHTIIGDKEKTNGFGQWIINANEVWFNSITAKTKERIVRPFLAHENAYEDMRRFLKLAPNEVPEDFNVMCTTSTYSKGGKLFERKCACGTFRQEQFNAGDSCFHREVGISKEVDSKINQGTFCSEQNKIILYLCESGAQNTNEWVSQKGSNCYHKTTEVKCRNLKLDQGSAVKPSSGGAVFGPSNGNSPAKNKGEFCNAQGTTTAFVCGWGEMEGWAKQNDGCYHQVTKKTCNSLN